MQSFGKVVGAYFGIGLGFATHDYYGSLKETEMYVERFGYSEKECAVMRRMAFTLATVGWISAFHAIVKYRPPPHTWEEMNPYERDVTESGAKMMKMVAEEMVAHGGLVNAWDSIVERFRIEEHLVHDFTRKNEIYEANRDVREIWKKLASLPYK